MSPLADDLVTRLEAMDPYDTPSFAGELMQEAAGNIEELRARITHLREGIELWASECSRCHGSGLVSIHIPGNEGVPESDADDQPCPDCEEIREYLK